MGGTGKNKILNDDGNYEGYIQKSPAKNNKGRENHSPSGSLNRNKDYPLNPVNDSLLYVNNNYNPVNTKMSSQNSPLRSSGRNEWDPNN